MLVVGVTPSVNTFSPSNALIRVLNQFLENAATKTRDLPLAAVEISNDDEHEQLVKTSHCFLHQFDVFSCSLCPCKQYKRLTEQLLVIGNKCFLFASKDAFSLDTK